MNKIISLGNYLTSSRGTFCTKQIFLIAKMVLSSEIDQIIKNFKICTVYLTPDQKGFLSKPQIGILISSEQKKFINET